PRQRREEEDWQRLAQQHQRRERGRPGELQHEIEQRDGEKPVPSQRDQRADVEESEVAVVAQEAEVHAIAQCSRKQWVRGFAGTWSHAPASPRTRAPHFTPTLPPDAPRSPPARTS